MSRFAWVTLATNDTYALGALVLAHSLKRAHTAHEIAVLITPGVSPAMREQLSTVFSVIKEVDVMDSKDSANLALLSRPDLGVTFTKLHCWRLTQFSKCVFLDADTLVIQNCDELFEREEFSAAPDAGWPDCFNSGVFVYAPSDETFAALMEFALKHGSFDGGDQGLLNMFFKDWATQDIGKHLPFIYNMCSTATYSYLPAFKFFGGQVKIVHFIGHSKPWLQVGTSGTSISEYIQYWWELFQAHVARCLSAQMGGLAGALGGGDRSIIEEHWHRQNWEQGNIDYMGRDAFENIWKKISDTLSAAQRVPSPPPPPPPPPPPTQTSSPQTPPPTPPPTPSATHSFPERVPEMPVPPNPPRAPPAPQTPPPASQTPPAPQTPPPASQTPPVFKTPPPVPHTPPPAPQTPPPVPQTPPSPQSPSLASQTASSDSSPPSFQTPPSPQSPPPPQSPPVFSTPPASPSAQPSPPVPASQQVSQTPPLHLPQKSSGIEKITKPLTPPSSPGVQPQKPPLVQPGTPIVTAPTPPTSPPSTVMESPLSKVVASEPQTQPPAGTTAGSAADPPVPPKRKTGKGPEKKGKGKK